MTNTESSVTIPKMNKLSHEKSPYLRQHAQNPVDWYPWGEEAFQKAKNENKPVFISIGYATCHWCHVMAHESFEDVEIAEILNKYFVSIKVDREERPDIDSIYMTVCQMMTGHGGWPLTAFASPDKEPFFAGTYFPKESHSGRLGFKDLILRINDVWTQKKPEVLVTLQNVKEALVQAKTILTSSVSGDISEFLAKVNYELTQDFDAQNGGFGSAPKFPSSHKILFLMHHFYFYPSEETLKMIRRTLYGMHKGAFFDHIGGGVHRYSTDEKWELPHFEKMLYDQANVALAYTSFYQIEKNIFYKTQAESILNFCIKDLKMPSGGYASAYDADSEGEEGVFYIWTVDELRQQLSEKEFDFLNKYFELKPEGNYVDEATGQLTQKNILYLKKSFEGLSDQEYCKFEAEFMNIKAKIYSIREKRPKPLLDNKILTDWNSFLSVAFLRAGFVFQNERYISEGLGILNFLEKNLNQDGLYYHRICEDQIQYNRFLDDQAYMLWASLEAYVITNQSIYLKKAILLLENIDKSFLDQVDGTYFLTPEDQEVVISRTKDFYDGAMPSANSLMLFCKLKLARYTRNIDLEKKTQDKISCLTVDHAANPSAFSFFAIACALAKNNYKEVILRGDSSSKEVKELVSFLRNDFLPDLIFHSFNKHDFINIPEQKEFLIYICQNQVCSAPTTRSVEAIKMLKN